MDVIMGPITLDTLITIVTFIGAIAYQSATLKKNVEVLTDRITKLEESVKKITELLISAEAIRVHLEALDLRLQHIENRCFVSIPKPSDCKDDKI